MDKVYGRSAGESIDQIVDIHGNDHGADSQEYDVHIGGTYWFEYHCWESHESADADLWYRSHQRVRVLRMVEPGAGKDIRERGYVGHPAVFEIMFEDGTTAHATEDELMVSQDEFTRLDPPKGVTEGTMRESDQVPRYTAHLQLGPVSQVNIMAAPLSWEAKANFSAMRSEALAIAEQFKLPVILTFVDDVAGQQKRFTFSPPSAGESVVEALLENDDADGVADEDPKAFLTSHVRPKSIDIVGKLWWRRSSGGMYHTAHVYVDGVKVHVTPEEGGGGSQYLENATRWLEAENYIPTRPSHRIPGWAWIRDTLNIPLNYYSEDVKRRRDLF